MLRSIWRFGVVLLPLLFGIGVVAYAAAHTDKRGADLREFLHPGECATPCWQGIRPGVTRSFEAIEILKAHSWVTNLYSIQGSASNESFLRWDWTGAQPAVVDGEGGGQMWFYDGRVYAINIPLAVQFSDVWAAFGAPETENFQTAPLTPPQSFYNAYYFGGTVEIRGAVACPINPRNLLSTLVDVYIAAPENHPAPGSSSSHILCRTVSRS